MTKRIAFVMIGFFMVFGFVAQAVPAHAATSAYVLIPETASLLKQALDVLASVLNQLDARLAVNDATLPDKVALSDTLDAFRGSLLAINAAIKPQVLAEQQAAANAPQVAQSTPQPTQTVTQLQPAQTGEVALKIAEQPVAPTYAPNTSQAASAAPLLSGKRLLLVATVILLAFAGFMLLKARKGKDDGALAEDMPEPTFGEI